MKMSFALPVFLFMFFGCQTNNKAYLTDRNNQTIDLWSFLNNSADANFLIERSMSFNSEHITQENIIGGVANYPGIQPKAITIDNLVLNSSNEYMIQNFNPYSNLFGRSWSVKFNDEVIDSSFYNSQCMYVSYDMKEYGANIREGMSFKWNPDSLSQGVSIKLIATTSSNTSLKRDIMVTETIVDNGSFTIPKGWLSRFPKGAFVYLSMYRGNYKTYLTSDNRSVQIVGL